MTSPAPSTAIVPVNHKPWPGQAAGSAMTLTTMAQKIREGRTPAMRQFAEMVVRDAGHAAHVQLTHRQIAEVFRSYVRGNVRYRADPVMMEMIQSADISLCVPGTRGEKVCIPVGDCDDVTVALGAMFAAYGIDVRILALDYGAGIQPHVMLEFQDNSGSWLTCDATPPYPPIGYRPRAKYQIVDPFGTAVAPAGFAQGDFVGVGVTAASAIAYQQVTLPAVAHTGLRYRVGMQLTFNADPTDNYRAKEESQTFFTQQGWVIESFEPQGPGQIVPGSETWIQSWILQGIATQEIALQDTSTVQYLVVGVQSSSATPPAPAAPIVPTTGDISAPRNVSLAGGIVTALALGAVGGLGYYVWKNHRHELARIF